MELVSADTEELSLVESLTYYTAAEQQRILQLRETIHSLRAEEFEAEEELRQAQERLRVAQQQSQELTTPARKELLLLLENITGVPQDCLRLLSDRQCSSSPDGECWFDVERDPFLDACLFCGSRGSLA